MLLTLDLKVSQEITSTSLGLIFLTHNLIKLSGIKESQDLTGKFIQVSDTLKSQLPELISPQTEVRLVLKTSDSVSELSEDVAVTTPNPTSYTSA